MASARGFTLLELVVVMVVIAVLAVASTRFIQLSTDSYLAVNRRAQVLDVADGAVRRLARDLRLALPNSVRVGGAGKFLEYAPTSNGGRYLAESGVAPLTDILNFTAADSSFDYLGPSLAGASGYVVVFNTGQTSVSGCAVAPGGADVYEGCNRSAITAVTASKVSFSALQFPFDSPGHRFHIVPAAGPVTIACENVNTVNGNGSGTLRLYSNYATGAGNWGGAAPSAAPTAAGRTVNLLADNVSGCSIAYVSGVTAGNGLVTLRLEIKRGGETITLHHQVHVDNVP